MTKRMVLNIAQMYIEVPTEPTDKQLKDTENYISEGKGQTADKLFLGGEALLDHDDVGQS